MGYAQVAGVEDSIRRGEGGQEKIKAALLAAHGGDDEGFLQGTPVTALGGLSVRAWRKFITKLNERRCPALAFALGRPWCRDIMRNDTLRRITHTVSNKTIKKFGLRKL